jgi:3-hydroxypropanoate dehydrogenase
MGAEAMTEQVFDQVFRTARTANGWTNQMVSDETLRKIYDLMKWGPTAANCTPLRIVFVKTKEAKEKLKGCLMPANADKTMAAPVTAILAYDTRFYDHLPFLYPAVDARSWYAGNEAFAAETAARNVALQSGYFMVAARMMGLDCGPMSGFDKAKVDAAFFPDGRFKSDLLCNLGIADPAATHPRGPRFKFEDVCRVA